MRHMKQGGTMDRKLIWKERCNLQLPAAFIEKYQHLLGAEAPAFLATFDQPSQSGFRTNPLKNGQPTASIAAASGPTTHVKNGWFGKVNGKSLDHVTGWVYSQEPSAMTVGEVVAPQPGERVLDLCAAPGGKSTHLLAQMHDTGLLVANEIFSKRAKILAENLERWGAKNAVVTNEAPDQLAPHFSQFFDRILVDAPCSGEGMFRKEPAGIEYWTPIYPAECANRQKKILASALTMLKPGGTLVYSTCTFAPEEDEQVIAWLLKEYPHLALVPIEKTAGMDDGRPAWADGNPALAKTCRLFPHHFAGEGHFIAKLVDQRPAPAPKSARKNKKRQTNGALRLSKAEFALAQAWFDQVVPSFELERLVKFGDQVYAVPTAMPTLNGLSVLRPGLHLGTLKKRRFEPALALALALAPEQVTKRVALTMEQWRAYVHGEALPFEAPDGWALVVCQNHSCGWGKVANRILKNFYPKGLRF